MSFADPQSITISTVTTPLPRVSVDEFESQYLSADGLIKLTASHSFGKRNRHLIRIDHNKLTSDPFRPAENVKVGMSNYLVFDIPPAGYTAAEAMAVYQGFKTQISASADLLISKLLGNES